MANGGPAPSMRRERFDANFMGRVSFAHHPVSVINLWFYYLSTGDSNLRR